MTSVAADYEHMEIQQQYSDVNNRWDVEEWDNENSSARLFERSRIKALAGKLQIEYTTILDALIKMDCLIAKPYSSFICCLVIFGKPVVTFYFLRLCIIYL